jgi:hypothetical protein
MPKLSASIRGSTIDSRRSCKSLFALLLLIMASCAGSGCARVLPQRPATAALYRDMRRLVSLAETAGWSIDRHELRELLPDALLSVCRVPIDDRRPLLAWLDARIAALGGPVELAYRRAGKRLSEVEELLELTRVRMLAGRALRDAGRDCPFWLEPGQRFAGRQISDDRWHLSAGGGGKVILSRLGGENDFSFGGAGRLLLGRSFGSRWSLYTGIELGGSATFPEDNANGERGSLVLGFDLVTPLVARFRLVNLYFEFEIGYLAHFNESSERGSSGLHVGLSAGARASRKGWFFPGAAFGIAYEQTFPPDGEQRLQMLKLGFRVVFDVDF